MLKKKYKPNRLNKWYVKHFILAPCARGFEVSEMAVVWWCFFASMYNSKFLYIGYNHVGEPYIKVQKENEKGFSFHANSEMYCPYENDILKMYKQVNGVVYEITYDTPVDD